MYYRRQGYDYLLDLLWTFPSVQLRMMAKVYRLAKQAPSGRHPRNHIPEPRPQLFSLKRLSRDMVMQNIIANNSQERDVGEMVDKVVSEAEKMGQIIKPIQDYLKESFTGGSISDQHG